MEFASKTEAEMMNGLQNDDMIGGFVNNVTVTSLSPGSIVVGAEIVVSGDVATALPGTADSSSAFDVQLEVANQVSDATNDAVMQSLSNNGNLGSTDVQVEISEVSVPVTADGTNLPDTVTPFIAVLPFISISRL
nr:uncharacterized protein LOC129266995 [Lytechinus pictus]